MIIAHAEQARIYCLLIVDAELAKHRFKQLGHYAELGAVFADDADPHTATPEWSACGHTACIASFSKEASQGLDKN